VLRFLRREPRATVPLWIGLYVLVILVSPVLHHDFECHQKSPGHCVSCIANPLAPRSEATVSFSPAGWVEAGQLPSPDDSVRSAVSISSLSDRAPPR
jgi:hypothetical protein